VVGELVVGDWVDPVKTTSRKMQTSLRALAFEASVPSISCE
jgi:hypothetical protein